MRFKVIEDAQDRLNHIESNVLSREKNNFYDFKKNNEYSTLWDDKKILAKKNYTPYNLNNNNIYHIDNSFRNSNNGNVVSSAQYGAFFKNQLSQPY